MAIESIEQVRQFMTLKKKSDQELRAICEGLELSTKGAKNELLDRLMEGPPQQQDNVLKPQAIPLRTRDQDGNTIDPAIKAIQYWRKLMFEQRSSQKEFRLLDVNGGSYKATMRYLKCPESTLQKILEEGWYDPRYLSQKELIAALRSNPENFFVTIIQKRTGKGGDFMMLHAELRREAS